MIVVGVENADLINQARRLAEAGWTRLELCGGVDVDTAAAVRAALPAGVQAGLNRYGFESLELITDYKLAYGRGEIRPSVFMIPGAAGSSRVDHVDGSIVPVSSPEHAEKLAVDFARDGVGLVELYGGLGTEYAAAVVRGAERKIPVGFVGYDN